jgi:class II lanthipeptide synthase
LITEEPRFRQAAEAGFAYERSLFSEEQENWPDFRIFDQLPPSAERVPAYAIAWCHGAPGIGLSRLRAFELTGDEQHRREALAALCITARALRDSTLPGFSLCHGIFGNAELLLVGAEILGDQSSRDSVENTALQAAERHPKDEYWLCGIPGGGETPNLMLGLAGIGYHYLQLYDPRLNPSVFRIA